MSIDHLLGVIAVSDMETARPWYERLMERPPDNRPMDTLVEWRVTGSGWLQVFHDPERAGSSLLNFAVDDVERHVHELVGRGLAAADIVTATKGVRLSTLADPDGNQITFIGGFREVY